MKDKTNEARIVEEEEKTKKREKGKLAAKEEIEIERMIEEKQEEEKDLIEIRMVEEIVPKKFHKCLKIFEKKKSEKMPVRKILNHTIDLRE